MTQVTEAAARTVNAVIPHQRDNGADCYAATLSLLDTADVEHVVAALPSLATWPTNAERVRRFARYTRRWLLWLQPLATEGWQARWEAAEGAYGTTWRTWPLAVTGTAAGPDRELTRGLGCLIKLRLVKPSYRFLTGYGSTTLFTDMRVEVSPELFERAEQSARLRKVSDYQVRSAMTLLTTMVIRLGGGLDEITTEQLLQFQHIGRRPQARSIEGGHVAWQMLVDLQVLPAGSTLAAALRSGPLPTAELVGRYQLRSTAVRQLLIRYLDERRPALDYNTFTGLVSRLAGQFWADIERHHPGITSIGLPDEVAQAWRDRMRAPLNGRITKRHWDVFIAVRAFYCDIAQWALSDASWAPWAFPSPVRKRDTEGAAKQSRATTAAMHQRTRERLPHLPRLVDTAERWKNDRAGLLASAGHSPTGAVFDHDGRRYRRLGPENRPRAASERPSHLIVEDLTDKTLINVTVAEDEAFWAWAVIETLRHTGIRIEELLELTQLAIVSHRLADTGEVVPLLQIVPSKSNEERLLLVTPELASVLAAIVSRIRNPDGTVPAVARYDNYEHTTGPELPHLFQRCDGFQHRNGWRRDVFHSKLVRDLLTRALARAGITGPAGRPLRYTPHDFRRMFATEAVTGGLPVHIAAKVLGHANINTTQAYTAVFDDDLIRTYRTFVDERRAMRPTEEYREPTDDEWTQFQQHFHVRKLELGDCGRPYGTPCAHEHACVRCPMLRVDPRQRQRLIEIIRNLALRIAEAKDHRWHGEVEGLTVSLHAAEAKLAALDRATRNQPSPTPLGLPAMPQARTTSPTPADTAGQQD